MKSLFLRKFIHFAKPAKCPNCGNTYFHWSHGGPNGENYWKCNKCDYLIKE